MTATAGSTTWSVGLTDHVEVVAPSPDGSSVAVGSLGGDAVVLDTTTGEATAKLADHPMGVLAAAWSPDGTRLAIGGQDGHLRMYGPDAGSVATVPLDGWVTTLAWSPTGLLAAGSGRTLTLLDKDGGVRAQHPDHPSTVTAVAWSADGSRVGVASYGGIRWYDPGKDPSGAGQGPARTFTWKGSLLALALSPTGKWACAGSQDASVHIWKLWSAKELSMSGYPAKVEHLAFRPDGRWMAVGCLGEVTFWDFGGSGPSGTRPAQGDGHDRHITSLCWEPGESGGKLVSGGADGRVALWPSPTRTGNTLRPDEVHELDIPVARLAWPAGHGRTLLVGHVDGVVRSLAL